MNKAGKVLMASYKISPSRFQKDDPSILGNNGMLYLTGEKGYLLVEKRITAEPHREVATIIHCILEHGRGTEKQY